MSTKHIHHYDKLIIKRIRAENPNYLGTTGDKAFLIWICSCGYEDTVDMGSTISMFERYNTINASRKKKSTINELPHVPGVRSVTIPDEAWDRPMYEL